MMGGNGMDDLLRFPELSRQVRSDQGMGSLDFMVYGLPDVVQQTCPFGLLHVDPQLGGHRAGEESHLQRMLKNILGKTGAVFELADQFDQFGVDPVDPHVKGRPFAALPDGFLDFLLRLGHDLFDSPRMDAAVGDQPFQGDAGNFPADGVEARR